MNVVLSSEKKDGSTIFCSSCAITGPHTCEMAKFLEKIHFQHTESVHGLNVKFTYIDSYFRVTFWVHSLRNSSQLLHV